MIIRGTFIAAERTRTAKLLGITSAGLNIRVTSTWDLSPLYRAVTEVSLGGESTSRQRSGIYLN